MNIEQIENEDLFKVYRRQPANKREAEIMREGLATDDKSNIVTQIEHDIKQLKKCRYSDDKKTQYNLIASGLGRYLKQTNTATFKRGLILSFFDGATFPKSTRERHIKTLTDTLKETGIISDDKTEKIYKQQRRYTLKSNDFDGSYFALMDGNGYKEVNYFVWYCDKEGVPRRRKVATSNINGVPRDKNGDLYEGEIGFSVLKQTIPREKQGVYSYGNKSIAVEKRQNFVNCYKVN